MKTKMPIIIAALLLPAFNPQFSTAFAQGALTPSGPPGATMLTLLQIEPRTPISTVPYTITQPGSYYLTTNLTGTSGTNGITISSPNVTLDLRGFSLTGVPGSLDGIHVSSSFTNVMIMNGTVGYWGGIGIYADGIWGGQFTHLTLVANVGDGLDPGRVGQASYCISTGNGADGFGAFCSNTKFENCTATANDGFGFSILEGCLLQGCSANLNGLDGIVGFPHCTVEDCVAHDNGFDGIDLLYGAGGVIAGCVCNNNGSQGIYTVDGYTIKNCAMTGNGGNGINTGNSSVIDSCAANTNDEDNIVTGNGCTLNQCTANGSTTGNGFTLASGNTITGSSAIGNATNGIDASDRTTIQNCTATFNGNAGIHIGVLVGVRGCSCVNNGVYGILADNNGDGVIADNNCSYNGTVAYSGTINSGAGILVTNSPGCRIEGNTLDFNNAALIVAPSNRALILRNSADANIATNYVFGAGNSWGPIVNATAGGDISTIPNSSHPDANFIH